VRETDEFESEDEIEYEDEEEIDPRIVNLSSSEVQFEKSRGRRRKTSLSTTLKQASVGRRSQTTSSTRQKSSSLKTRTSTGRKLTSLVRSVTIHLPKS